MGFWDALKKGAKWVGKLVYGGHEIGDSGWYIGVIIKFPEDSKKISRKDIKKALKRTGWGIGLSKQF